MPKKSLKSYHCWKFRSIKAVRTRGKYGKINQIEGFRIPDRWEAGEKRQAIGFYAIKSIQRLSHTEGEVISLSQFVKKMFICTPGPLFELLTPYLAASRGAVQTIKLLDLIEVFGEILSPDNLLRNFSCLDTNVNFIYSSSALKYEFFRKPKIIGNKVKVALIIALQSCSFKIKLFKLNYFLPLRPGLSCRFHLLSGWSDWAAGFFGLLWVHHDQPNIDRHTYSCTESPFRSKHLRPCTVFHMVDLNCERKAIRNRCHYHYLFNYQ